MQAACSGQAGQGQTVCLQKGAKKTGVLKPRTLIGQHSQCRQSTAREAVRQAAGNRVRTNWLNIKYNHQTCIAAVVTYISSSDMVLSPGHPCLQ